MIKARTWVLDLHHNLPPVVQPRRMHLETTPRHTVTKQLPPSSSVEVSGKGWQQAADRSADPPLAPGVCGMPVCAAAAACHSVNSGGGKSSGRPHLADGRIRYSAVVL